MQKQYVHFKTALYFNTLYVSSYIFVIQYFILYSFVKKAESYPQIWHGNTKNE
jgi:hypothetical protein